MIVAAKDGTGDFTSVSEAVGVAGRHDTVFVKKGLYRERVEVFTPDITIIGEDRDETVIEYGLYAKMMCGGEKLGTFRSYTFLANADGFCCKNMTIANTAGFGSDVGQAIAVYAEGDRICFENCRILGHQDTLFTGPLPHKEIEKGGFKGPTEFAERRVCRQTYRNCYIEGEVDFIFGSAAAVFEDCELFSIDCGKEVNGYVATASTYCGEEVGYIFKNCRFTGNCPAETVYLGRPWRNYAKTVLINCELGAHIKREGFHDWGKPEARETVLYALSGCYGDGYRPEGLAPFVKII
ncbi:MAG: pectin methylesterase [Oscillospiraceae bacterium]|nr:pectin methylesterase [Oscillospiraceae bacterium]